MPSKEKRATCVKCGRKRLKSYLIYYYWLNKCYSNKEKWFRYPNKSSWICIEDCLNFRN